MSNLIFDCSMSLEEINKNTLKIFILSIIPFTCVSFFLHDNTNNAILFLSGIFIACIVSVACRFFMKNNMKCVLYILSAEYLVFYQNDILIWEIPIKDIKNIIVCHNFSKSIYYNNKHIKILGSDKKIKLLLDELTNRIKKASF